MKIAVIAANGRTGQAHSTGRNIHNALGEIFTTLEPFQCGKVF